ncbi:MULTISPECIES: hypothetical protein [Pantoea]|jgi:outer membrane lipoprotein-sorting protein|uniref:Lipoprotein n=1 Tax=Pantoea brenneri TaxID=472694 RepID=A0A7Y6NIL2_9GAMM|nr:MULTISPECIES: hypothetical protein [Pantoea]MBZ6397585.1 hypothetical protein [Pantoea sp.]MBZ6440734.1 hypothetical protein [Pantoea sp.]NUY44160.1 hypothetical protein [Pantoea brenneri]NUY51681.1 hypothetical protein [Pantoea brenneri]NUY61975.1 hypothetical protein [Pantoea brenneri]
MKKTLVIAALIAASLSLTGCKDKGVYGTYKNAQYGLTLKLSEKNIEFKGQDYTVVKWDSDDEKKTYVAHSTINISKGNDMKWNFRFKKADGGVYYDGAFFKED